MSLRAYFAKQSPINRRILSNRIFRLRGDCFDGPRKIVGAGEHRLATTVLKVKAEKEDLGCLSPPGLICMHHSVQNHKRLSHTSRERHLLCLTVFDQPFIKFPDDRIKFFSRSCRHVQNTSHICSTSIHSAFALLLATVFIDWRNANQSSYFLAIEFTQLR